MFRLRALRPLLALCVSLVLFAGRLPSHTAGAQTFDYAHSRLPLGSMAGQWRFHPGDDPRFASPALDDTQWPTLSSDNTWTAQGFPNLTGFAWYRFRLMLPGSGDGFSLMLPEINSGYECYLDGTLVAQVGPVFPSRQLDYNAITPIRIPAAGPAHGELPQGTRTVEVALRVWHSPVWSSYEGGGPTPGSAVQEVFGPTKDIEHFQQRSREHQQFRNSEWLVIGIVDLLAGLASLTLYLLRRAEREYLWFGLAVLTPGLPWLLNYYTLGQTLSVATVDGALLLATMISRFAFLAFYRRLLQAPRDWLFRVAILCILLNPIPLILLEGFGVLSIGSANICNEVLHWPYEIWILWLLIRRSLARRADARLLLAPIAMIFGLEQIDAVTSIARGYGLPVQLSIDAWVVHVPFPVSATNIAWLLFLLAMGIILLYRFARTRREEEQYAAEFASARQIQELLVPVSLVPVRGFALAAEYRPARVVGGDFYQIIPVESGGLLLVVGDVAGKGLPAAMLVAMLVGVMRTQAVLCSEPAAVLGALNDRLLGRADGGFSTCVVARISARGHVELANAGHPAPYLNGEELASPGALPLGIAPGEQYPTLTVQLRAGDRLTFITDGIPEARNGEHRLFGFEATRRLSRENATTLVEEAQRFGQDDDLTAVTVDFLGESRELVRGGADSAAAVR